MGRHVGGRGWLLASTLLILASGCGSSPTDSGGGNPPQNQGGGATWLPMTVPVVVSRLRGVSMWDEMNAILVGDGTSNQETILLTHDGGDTWVNKGPGGSSIVVSTSVWAEGSNVAYVGQGGGVVLKTNDGGTSWFNLRGGLTSRNHIRAIWMTSATDGVIVGTESKILYTRSTGLVPE